MTLNLSAIAKWPDVPDCYDWLLLDRRGNWRLQGERITHSGLITFINRQYGCDESGRWFLQNGPQRVFVNLAYTPWVFHFSDEALLCHTGEIAGNPKKCFLDEEGNILLLTPLGIGLLDDRDLPDFLDACLDEQNAAVNDEKWSVFLSSDHQTRIFWHNLPLEIIVAENVAMKFSFQPNPHP